MRFHDRTEAGRQLGAAVADLDLSSPLVLALPRGGVPVAFEVASRLGAPLEVFVARKVGAPGRREFGIGAIAEGDDPGGVVVDEEALRVLGVSRERFDALAAEERTELDRRIRHYRGDRALPEIAGRDVIVVDDGLATGVTAEAALRALRLRQPHRLLLAVPVCAPDTATRLSGLAEVVCVSHPPDFGAVGRWYERFNQTTDTEVLDLLARSATPTPRR